MFRHTEQQRSKQATSRQGQAQQERMVQIEVDGVARHARLALPRLAIGVALFVQGSDRSGARSEALAPALREAGIGTLRPDLLSEYEEKEYYTRFDIALLARRLGAAFDWLRQEEDTRALPLGIAGAGTGAAAALLLAAWRGAQVAALVSYDGRPDMAGRGALDKVRAPTLLLVGNLDQDVLGLNRMAFSAMHCDKQLQVVMGAGQHFDQPEGLATASLLATDWFSRHFAGRAGR
ncbi:MAG: alpha/beta hydrolase [Pseudomonadota bacterium]